MLVSCAQISPKLHPAVAHESRYLYPSNTLPFSVQCNSCFYGMSTTMMFVYFSEKIKSFPPLEMWH